MKRYLVVILLRYDHLKRIVSPPVLSVGVVEAGSVSSASNKLHELHGILNLVLAVIEVSHSTEIETLDLQSALLKLYGNSNYKQPPKGSL